VWAGITLFVTIIAFVQVGQIMATMMSTIPLSG